METPLEKKLLPQHLGIIMDGNGRWAKQRGLPRTAGHTAGAANFRTIARYCSNIGIPYLTIYAFSTENWKRPSTEVSALMLLFRQYMEEAIQDFANDDIKVRFIGDISMLPENLQKLAARIDEVCEKRTGMVLNIAINYGGRAEIAAAARRLAEEVCAGRLRPEEITEERIAAGLYTAGQPDPDLIIRPSGENRASNFLLWQSAYSEYIVMDVLWPDFTTQDLDRALRQYAGRNRRFGGV